MPKYENVGWLYPKKQFMNTVDSTDWETIAALVVPPYAICQRYWLNFTTASNSNASVWEQMYIGIKGLYFSIDPNSDLTSDTDPVNLMHQYAPLEIGEWADADTGSDETELPGHFDSAPNPNVFFEREKSLNLNDGKSLTTASNELTYADNFSTSGNPYRKGMGIKVEDAKLLIFVMRRDIANTDTDWSSVLSGNTASPQHMTQEMWKSFGRDSTTGGVTVGTNAMDTNVQAWMLNGYRNGTSSQDLRTMATNVKLSARIKMVAPTADRHISGG